MDKEPKIQKQGLEILVNISKLIAFAVSIGLLLASMFLVYTTFISFFKQDPNTAIQDGLFVLIVLEMFYVTRSFIRHGSINVSIVISVGIIAAVKEMIFQLNSLTLQSAIAFGILFTTLSITYFTERIYYRISN